MTLNEAIVVAVANGHKVTFSPDDQGVKYDFFISVELSDGTAIKTKYRWIEQTSREEQYEMIAKAIWRAMSAVSDKADMEYKTQLWKKGDS